MIEVTPMVNSVSGQSAFNLTYTPASKGTGGVLELVEADTGNVVAETPVLPQQSVPGGSTGATLDVSA
jgi:hypothetical protein